jgi:DNA-binding NarL/FixJ family response regulator
MHSDKQYVKGILEAGADGYLLKNCTKRQLTDAIQSVHSGKKNPLRGYYRTGY